MHAQSVSVTDEYVQAYATTKTNELCIFIVNKDSVNSYPLQIHIGSGFTPSNGTAEIQMLTGPSMWSFNTPLGPNRDPNYVANLGPPQVSSLAVSNDFNYTMPPHCAMVMKLQGTTSIQIPSFFGGSKPNSTLRVTMRQAEWIWIGNGIDGKNFLQISLFDALGARIPIGTALDAGKGAVGIRTSSLCSGEYFFTFQDATGTKMCKIGMAR
jgi:hypothetical protein